jgi:hypothetical protein
MAGGAPPLQCPDQEGSNAVLIGAAGHIARGDQEAGRRMLRDLVHRLPALEAAMAPVARMLGPGAQREPAPQPQPQPQPQPRRPWLGWLPGCTKRVFLIAAGVLILLGGLRITGLSPSLLAHKLVYNGGREAADIIWESLKGLGLAAFDSLMRPSPQREDQILGRDMPLQLPPLGVMPSTQYIMTLAPSFS